MKAERLPGGERVKDRRKPKGDGEKWGCNDRRSGNDRRAMPCRCDRCYVWYVKNMREKEK